jgi:anti-sigma B factor antagonist
MADPGFEIEIMRDDDVSAVVAVVGELDLATAPTLSDALGRVAHRPGKTVRVDMERVGFLDSSGISALVEEQKRRAEAGGRLVLHRASDQVVRVLEISGLGTFFELSPDAPS